MSSEPVIPLESRDILTEPTTVAPVVPVPERELPASSEVNPRLRNTAESVGNAVGKAVNKVRALPQRVTSMKERFTVIRGGGQAASAADIGETARQRIYEARSRARYYAHEYPVQFIAAAGAAGFVLGLILRIWRSSRRAY